MTKDVVLSPLAQADGSASYTSNGYSVIAAVNGPVEVQRRDEIPEASAIDVVLRPAVGVGGVRERHLESIIEKTLRQVILVSAHPRTLIQVTLQVVAAPDDSNASNNLHQSASNLPLLPILLQSSMLALLSTSLPLTMTFTTTLIAVSRSGELVRTASVKALKEAASLHVLAFSSLGELLVAESEGTFDVDIWDQVYTWAEKDCRMSDSGDLTQTDDVDMDLSKSDTLEDSLRSIIEEKAATEYRWKES
ncbi:exosome non-catalytic core subunit rrp46 [Xanthoria calcicola]